MCQQTGDPTSAIRRFHVSLRRLVRDWGRQHVRPVVRRRDMYIQYPIRKSQRRAGPPPKECLIGPWHAVHVASGRVTIHHDSEHLFAGRGLRTCMDCMYMQNSSCVLYSILILFVCSSLSRRVSDRQDGWIRAGNPSMYVMCVNRYVRTMYNRRLCLSTATIKSREASVWVYIYCTCSIDSRSGRCQRPLLISS